MFSPSSPLALKGQLKLNITITIVLAIFLFALYVTSCEARHLRVNGKYSSNKSSLPSKDVAEVGDTKKQIRSTSASMVHDSVFDHQETRVGRSINRSMGAGATSINRSGGIRNTRHVARVPQQHPHREHKDDQGIHLDYAQPRARDSSRGSLRKRFEGIEVRSSYTRERSVLGVEYTREQVGSKATTVYSAETLAAMDYPLAHPAPAVHNR